MKGNRIYLSLGSNLGNRHQNIVSTTDQITGRVGFPDLVSSIYESSPWGYQSNMKFYNSCISLLTELEPLPLIRELLHIEKEIGRVRSAGGYADRLIDIDLLFYANIMVDHPGLVVPHPAIASRRFVLEPLAEIAPDLVHPATGLTIREILEKCTDPGDVKPLTGC